MISAARNPRSVYISMVSTGCCQMRFDSNYPTLLNGIINEEEFHESLANVNKSVSSIIITLICIILPFLCILGGAAALIAGGIVSGKSNENKFTLLLAIGGGILGFGLITSIIGYYIMQSRKTSRMRQAIAEESIKYNIIIDHSYHVLGD
ncbi:hypothetical protein I4U23_015932 [Adineta vaga]|nr:hypothetical protein I4U23_015932 [Adineta vaga]